MLARPSFLQTRRIAYRKAWCEHSCRHDQVGEDEAGHAEGQEDGLAGVCRPCQPPRQLRAHVLFFLPCPRYYSGGGCSSLPGCSVESTIFLACHMSGVISLTWPVLYATMAFFARSSPCLPTKSVLRIGWTERVWVSKHVFFFPSFLSPASQKQDEWTRRSEQRMAAYCGDCRDHLLSPTFCRL